MSITGILNNLSKEKVVKRHIQGFTLIELTLVIILMGFILSLTMPRIRNTLLSDDFKGASRKIISTITGLRTRAVSEHKDYYLIFDLEANSYWFEYLDMTELDRLALRDNASVLPKTVRIESILFKDKEKITTGKISIKFSKKGYIQPSIIHLGAEDGRKFTFLLRPFLGEVKVLEDYLDYDDIEQEP